MLMDGAISSAMNGLTAFSSQVGSISENLANTSTVGYKLVDTRFKDLVAGRITTAQAYDSVLASPIDRNTVSGQIAPSSNPTSFAVSSGQNFVQVGTVTQEGNSTFYGINNGGGPANVSQVPLYTQATDFSFDKYGVLVNSNGNCLMAVNESSAFSGNFPSSPTGAKLVPVSLSALTNQATGQASHPDYNTMPATASTTIAVNANFPATVAPVNGPTDSPPGPAAGLSPTDQNLSVNFVDSSGASQTLNLTLRKTATNTWSAIGGNIPNGSSTAGTTVIGPGGPFPTFSFDSNGKLTANTSLNLSIPALPSGAAGSSLTIQLGTPTTDSTQYTGESIDIRDTQDLTGHVKGSFQSASIDNLGNVSFNYSNGQSINAYRIPLTSFENPDLLQRINGATFGSNPLAAGSANAAWSNGSDITSNSVEQSNVDTATELTKLIQAQRAYSSNSKVLSICDQMQTTATDLKT